MVFVLEYVIIVFRSLKPRDSNPVSSLQLGLTAAFRPYLLYLCAAQQLRVVVILFADQRDHVDQLIVCKQYDVT